MARKLLSTHQELSTFPKQVHCSIQAEQESNTGFADGMLGPIYEYVSGDADRIAALEHQCMEAKGFHKVAAQ
jgi:hypothetical protein